MKHADALLAKWQASSAWLPSGRLHLQQGPIDLVIRAEGSETETQAAYRQAAESFDEILPGLIRDLKRLRAPLTSKENSAWSSPTAERMHRACRPHAALWITPMAAVAGAVADTILAAMREGRRLERAYVNNGGDIAFHIGEGRSFKVGLVTSLQSPGVGGRTEIPHESPVRGVATSGFDGRSLSRGIADAVTVLARDAATADAAATMIANAVDADHPAILRRPAEELQADSDLGRSPVTVAVGKLPAKVIEAALNSGAATAEGMLRGNLIEGANLALRNRRVTLQNAKGKVVTRWN